MPQINSWIPAIVTWITAAIWGIITFVFWRRSPKTTVKDEGLILLELLDEGYHRLKDITRSSIIKLREHNWQDMTVASTNLMWLTEIDIESAIERILIQNMYKFMAGKPLTVIQDSQRLGNKITESSLFTRNPEEIAKDVSVILKEKVPYLKKRMEHNKKYNKIQKRIERERDKFPNGAVSTAIDTYLDLSIKINAAWVLSTHDLDFMPDIERVARRSLPMKFKVILMGLPGRMDEEMRGFRNKVAIAILEYQRSETK